MIRTQAKPTVGLEQFCERLGARSPVAAAALRAAAGDDLRTLSRGEFLTRKGDVANATWIIERGEIDVGAPRIRVRRQGEMVGEAGVLRAGVLRSTDLIAAGPASVWCIGRDAISCLPADERAAVYEAMSASLLEKLDQAVDQRHDQLSDIEAREALLRSFVPSSGLGLIRARLANGDAAARIHRAAHAIIWFSDIAGFSKLVKSMSPEEAGAAAVALQTPIIRAIEHAGGELDKLMGDGAMAFWLAPGDGIPSDLAGAAVEAALSAARGVNLVTKARGWPDVSVRIGMHCGEVLVGDFGAEGRRSYTSIGPVVNTAARYEQARQTHRGKALGPVRISPELWARLPEASRGRFEGRAHQFKEKFPPMLKVHRLRANIMGELE